MWYAINKDSDGSVVGFVIDDDETNSLLKKDTEEEIKNYMNGHVLEARCEFIEL